MENVCHKNEWEVISDIFYLFTKTQAIFHNFYKKNLILIINSAKWKPQIVFSSIL